jgi:hypothetical protein
MIRSLGPALTLSGLFFLTLAPADPQSQVLNQGSHRMEITLERMEGNSWRAIDPGLVLAQGDRVRFRFRTNFEGYLYVTNQTTSGTYEQLFPRQETGKDNHVLSNKDYQVPSTSSVFRVSGPAGYEVVYWLITPARLSEAAPSLPPLPPDYKTPNPLTLTPRCDDTIFRARGDCVDTSAGPKLIPRGSDVPGPLAQAAEQGSGDLLYMRQQNKSVIASPVPLSGPVIYEFRLAHK